MRTRTTRRGSAEDDDIDPKQLDESFWTGGSSTK